MDYTKVHKVGVVIKELLTSFEVTNDEWQTIEAEIEELYLKESESVVLPKEKSEAYQSQATIKADNISLRVAKK